MEQLIAPLTVFGVTLMLFTVLLGLARVEIRRGERIVFTRIRGVLDRVVLWCYRQVRTLGVVLRELFLTRLTPRVTQLNLWRNEETRDHDWMGRRERKPQPRLDTPAEVGIIGQIRAHKSDMALTPTQKRKLLQQKLEERF
jgi:hypothetical protein